MHAPSRTALALAASIVVACLGATQAQAQVTFYEHDNYQGRNFVTEQSVADFRSFGFNDRASSIVVTSNRWEVCDDSNYGGRCVMLRPGSYPSLSDLGLNDRISSVRMVEVAPRPGDERSLPPARPLDAVTFYEGDDYQGRAYATQQSVPNFYNSGFNDRASSIVITSNRWEVCDDSNYGGRCVLLRPGSYPSLQAMGLNDRISSVRLVAEREPPQAPPAPPLQNAVTFYENDNFQGRAFGTQQAVADFRNFGFNDRASSIVVASSRWEVCDDVNFSGRCAMLRPGSYPSLSAIGLNDRISSVRMVGVVGQVYDDRNAPPAPPSAWQRRGNERLYEVNVTSVRAVVGPPEQRCWVERQVVEQQQDNRNVPGALAGALIGGILGHQIGGGTGRDIATAGGVVAGAVVGSRINSDGQRVASQDVQRCRTVPGPQSADYWDVSYTFRGQDHRVQMSRPPGPTITVNRQGEPRG